MTTPIAIEYLPTKSLKGATYNPRTIADEQMQALMRNIERFGLVDPIIVNQVTGNIVGGHQRVEAAKRLKLEQVPVVHVSLNRDEEKALNVALNKISGDWDLDKLKDLLGELQEASFDLELTGFNTSELESLLPNLGLTNPGLCDEDEVPELDEEAEPVTKVGDMILLGRHVLLCGDATDPDDMARLMGEDQADAVITDPPYNVAYEGGTDEKLTIENDDMEDAQFRAFLLAAFSLMCKHAKLGGPIYIFHADSEGENFRGAMREAGWLYKQCLIWVKNSLVLGRQDYQWQHEPCLYGWKPGAAHYWYGERDKTTLLLDEPIDLDKMKKEEMRDLLRQVIEATQTTVLREDKPTKNDIHPTMKPVRLIARPMENSTVQGDIVLDPFGGGGSTLIAAEKHGRTCRMMELSPLYCDRIIARWEHFTGQQAERL